MSQSRHTFELASDTCFCIGVATIDPLLNQITIEGAVKKIQPRLMHVLLCLAAEPGRLVTRASLFDRVWAGADRNDEALTQAICKLRNAFGDNAKNSRVIETIPKTGYRLVARVTAITTPPQQSFFPTASVSQPYPIKRPPKAKRNYLWIAVALLSVIIVETIGTVGEQTSARRSSMDSAMLSEVRSLAMGRNEPPPPEQPLTPRGDSRRNEGKRNLAQVPATDEVHTNPNRLGEELPIASDRPVRVNNSDGPVPVNDKVVGGATNATPPAPGCSTR